MPYQWGRRRQRARHGIDNEPKPTSCAGCALREPGHGCYNAAKVGGHELQTSQTVKVTGAAGTFRIGTLLLGSTLLLALPHLPAEVAPRRQWDQCLHK